ncbi:MAG: ribonuclease III [Planctomycetes bacterium]|nr:ribonuclease III [Planctomycetota bacterium]
MTVADDAEFRAFTAKIEALAATVLPAPELLRKALTHASAEADEFENNERLEFLGDSALGLAVTHLLYDALPAAREGDLTERRAHLVSRRTAAAVARRLGLPEVLATGRSLGGKTALSPTLFGNALEALVGAIYLQSGFEPCLRVVSAVYGPEIEAILARGIERNEKMLLQEWTQRVASALPTYQLLGQGGPPFARAFHVRAEIEGRAFPTAWGRTKRQAERLAAREALRVLRREGAIDPAELALSGDGLDGAEGDA